MSISFPLHSERRMSVVIALVLLPWLAVVLFTAGAWAAINFLGYAIIVFVSGYGIVRGALPAFVRSANHRSRSSAWHPCDLGSDRVLAEAGSSAYLGSGSVARTVGGRRKLGFWSDRTLWAKSTIAYGGSLVLLSVLICTVFFLPSALKDAVLRHDGSFNWMYVDTQYNYSISAGIKSGNTPPNTPGTATAELLYHFGPYAPAAAISRLTGLDLGDALARVTRGASLWALVLSCFGLGTLLSLKATGEKFGGIMSVAGLFFYGSLLSLFTNERNSSSHVTGAILFKIPRVEVLANGRSFQPSDLRAFGASRP